MFRKLVLLFLLVLLAGMGLAQPYGESDDFAYALKLFNEGFYDIAEQQFTVFMNRYPNSERVPDALYYKAEALYRLKDYANARIEFQSLAVTYPNHKMAPEAWLKVGDCYQKLGKWQDAAKAYETVKKLYSNNANAPLGLLRAARILMEHQDYIRAEQILRDLLDRYPDSAAYQEGRLLYAELLLGEKKLDQALNEFNKVLEGTDDPELLARAHLGKGRFYETLGQAPRAASQYEIVLQKFPRSQAYFPALENYTRLLIREKKFDQVTRFLNKNLNRFKSGEKNYRLKLYLSAAQYLQGNYFAARKTLQALEEKTNLSEAVQARLNFYLGAVYLKEGKWQKSLDYFNKLVVDSQFVQEAPLISNIAEIETGRLFLQLGNFQKGANRILLHLKNHPTDPQNGDLLAELVESSFRLNKPGRAEEFFQMFIQKFPDHPRRDDLLYALAKAYFRQHDFKKSQTLFERVAQEYPASAKYDSARIYLQAIREYFTVNESLGINRLAKLMGRLLSGEPREKLTLDLARIYLHDLKDFDESVRLCQSVIQETRDPALLGKANYLIGLSYWKKARKRNFVGKDATGEDQAAREALKAAMEYIGSLDNPDQVAFTFLKINVGDKVDQINSLEKLIQYWGVFLQKYPRSSHRFKVQTILADFYLQLGDTVRAIALLDSVAQSAPNQLAGESLYQIGGIYFQQKNFSRAAEVFKDFLLRYREHPYRTPAFLFLSQIAEREGNYSDAAQYLQHLLKEDNYSLQAELARSHLPELYLLAGQYGKTLEIVKPYLNFVNTDDPVVADFLHFPREEFLFYAGEANFRLQKLAEARRNLMQYLQFSRQLNFEDRAHYLLADISLQENDPESALLHLRIVAKKTASPLFVQANEKIADILFKQGKYEEAQKVYNQLLTRVKDKDARLTYQSRSLLCLIQLGKIKTYNANLRLFRKEYKKHPKLKEYLAQFELELGKRAYRNKNFDTAIKHFEKVMKSYRNTQFADDARYFLGLTYSTLNRVEKAQDIFTEFIKKHPDSDLLANVYISLGMLYYRGEKPEMAVETFKKAVELAQDPQTKQVAMSNLIRLYRDLGLWDGVLTQTRKYVEEFPRAKDIMDKKILLGSALIRLNRYTEAVEYLKKLKFEANSEQEPEIQFYIGEAYFNAGQYENAIREFVKIPLLSKKTKLQWEASALYYSGQAYEKLGRIDDAIRMYQEIINRPGILAELKREARKRIEQLKKS